MLKPQLRKKSRWASKFASAAAKLFFRSFNLFLAVTYFAGEEYG